MKAVNRTEGVSTILGNVKKYKKIIAFSAVLTVALSCVAVLAGAFFAGNTPRMTSAGAPPTQADMAGRPRLIWDAVRKPAGGAPCYPDIRDDINSAQKYKEESREPASGLFSTVLDITAKDDAIKLDFSLNNISGESLAFYFSSSQKFDIFIANRNGEEVYRWSHDKGFLTAIMNVKLKKDGKLSFSEVWDYRDNKGNRVPPGQYSVTVKFLAKLENGKIMNPDELTAVKDIEVD